MTNHMTVSKHGKPLNFKYYCYPHYFYLQYPCLCRSTVKLDLIVAEMLALPPKSSGNKNDSHLMIAIP